MSLAAFALTDEGCWRDCLKRRCRPLQAFRGWRDHPDLLLHRPEPARRGPVPRLLPRGRPVLTRCRRISSERLTDFAEPGSAQELFDIMLWSSTWGGIWFRKRRVLRVTRIQMEHHWSTKGP